MNQNNTTNKNAQYFFEKIIIANEQYKKEHSLFSNESEAKEFLLRNNIIRDFTSCLECGSHKIKLGKKNNHCMACKHTWNMWTGSVLDGHNSSYCDFLENVDNYCLNKRKQFIAGQRIFNYDGLWSEIQAKVIKPTAKVKDEGETDIFIMLEGNIITLRTDSAPENVDYLHLKIFFSDELCSDYSIQRIPDDHYFHDKLDDIQEYIGINLCSAIGRDSNELARELEEIIQRRNNPEFFQHSNIIKKLAIG